MDNFNSDSWDFPKVLLISKYHENLIRFYRCNRIVANWAIFSKFWRTTKLVIDIKRQKRVENPFHGYGFNVQKTQHLSNLWSWENLRNKRHSPYVQCAYWPVKKIIAVPLLQILLLHYSGWHSGCIIKFHLLNHTQHSSNYSGFSGDKCQQFEISNTMDFSNNTITLHIERDFHKTIFQYSQLFTRIKCYINSILWVQFIGWNWYFFSCLVNEMLENIVNGINNL